MTNLEWIRSLSVDELGNAILRGRCNLCVYQQSEECPTDKNGCYDCRGGFKEWCNARHVPEAKPCPVCKGKMDIRWQHSGCYLVCAGCGLHYGLNADIADAGIVEGGYRKEEALIDDWNTRLEEGENND